MGGVEERAVAGREEWKRGDYCRGKGREGKEIPG